MNFWTFLDRNIAGIGWFLVFTMLLGATIWGCEQPRQHAWQRLRPSDRGRRCAMIIPTGDDLARLLHSDPAEQAMGRLRGAP